MCVCVFVYMATVLCCLYVRVQFVCICVCRCVCFSFGGLPYNLQPAFVLTYLVFMCVCARTHMCNGVPMCTVSAIKN